MIRRKRILNLGTGLVAAATYAMAFAAVAMAQSPTDTQYGNTINTGGGGGYSSGDSAGLPLTGFDAVAFAIIGLVLIVTGVAVYRMSRNTRSRAIQG